MSLFFAFFCGGVVKGSSGDGTINLTIGFALCCGIFCALPTSLIRSSTVVHSLISLLAKRKISAHHFAKSSSTMPGIFLYTERSCFAGARLAVVAARVEYASTLPLRTPRQNPPGCTRSLLIPGGGNYWLQARVGGWHVAVRRGTDKYG